MTLKNLLVFCKLFLPLNTANAHRNSEENLTKYFQDLCFKVHGLYSIFWTEQTLLTSIKDHKNLNHLYTGHLASLLLAFALKLELVVQ